MLVLFAAVFPLVAALLHADSTRLHARTPSPVKFTGDVGYVSTAGNSSVQTLNLGNKISAKLDGVTFSEQFVVVHGRSRGETVTSLWRGALRGDVAILPTFGTYASVTFERNTFAGLASRVGLVAGLSDQMIRTDRHKLTVESGLSVTRQRGTGSNPNDLDFLGGRGAIIYVHQLAPRASVTETFEMLPNFKQAADLRINSETALLAPLTKQVGIKLSYVIRYDGIPQPGYLSTDRLFTSGIQINL